MHLSQDSDATSTPLERLEWRIGIHDRYRTNPREWYRWVFDKIDAPRDARVLDAGCGTANFWRVNKDRIPAAWHAFLCDISRAMANYVHQSLPSLPCSAAVLIGDSSSLPFPDGSLDAILVMHVLHRIPDVDAALRWFRRILKRNGKLYVTAGSLARLKNIDAIGTSCCPPLRIVTEDPKKRFSSETGGSVLKRHFPFVREWTYEDAVAFEDRDTLVRYMRSSEGVSSSAFDPPAFDILGQFLQNMLQTSGRVSIRNDAALFEARA